MQLEHHQLDAVIANKVCWSDQVDPREGSRPHDNAASCPLKQRAQPLGLVGHIQGSCYILKHRNLLDAWARKAFPLHAVVITWNINCSSANTLQAMQGAAYVLLKHIHAVSSNDV